MRHLTARVCLLTLAAGLPMFGQYGGFGGPSILSRGGGPSGRTGSNPVGFSLFAGATGSYSTNLNTVTTTPGSASLNYRDTFGLNGILGLQGYKKGERSSTSVDLSLGYYWTQSTQVSRGLSEAFRATHSRQISRRVIWFLGANLQSTNRAYAFANSRYSPEPTPDLITAQEEVFDTRTTRANVATGFTFQKSARLSFAVQGGAFGNERRNRNLIDSRGFMGAGSVQYALSRRHAIGASFSYGTFYFPGGYGETSYYSPQGTYSVSLSQAWSLNLNAGFYRANTDRLVVVQLDPFIAQLTGQRTALEAFQGTNTGFSGGLSLNGNYHRWGISLAAFRGIMPGNGIYSTSESTIASIMVNHTLGRSASFSMFVRGSQSKALSQTIGNSRYYSGGTSFSYRLTDHISMSSSVGVYRTKAAGQQIEFNRLIAQVGLFYSPGELPLHLF